MERFLFTAYLKAITMGNAPCSRRELEVSPEVLVYKLKRAAYKGSKKDLRELLRAGAPINGCHKYGKTALHEAVRHGQFRCVEILLNYRANVNVSTYDGLTPLHEAAEQGYVDCLKALICHGADVNAATRSHWTALHYAARNGHRDCLEVLLQHGANVNATANGGWRPLHTAVRHGHTMCVELLLHYKAEVDPPLVPAWRIVQVPLHHAAEYGHLACLEALLRQGADVNSKTVEGWTAMHSAALYGRTSCVEALIRYGGDVNAKTIFITQGTSYNDTPLHLAARHNHKLCIRKLIQANANLWTKNCLGLTAERFVTDPRLRDWMESVQRRPLTLQLQCSAAIRKYLQPDKTKNAITLPLPPNLLRQVLFEQDIKKIV